MKNHAIKLLHGHYHWLIINICCKWTTLIGESDILVHFDLSMVLNCKLKDVLRLCYNNNWESNTIARVVSRQLGFSTVGKLTIHFTCQ